MAFFLAVLLLVAVDKDSDGGKNEKKSRHCFSLAPSSLPVKISCRLRRAKKREYAQINEQISVCVCVCVCGNVLTVVKESEDKQTSQPSQSTNLDKLNMAMCQVRCGYASMFAQEWRPLQMDISEKVGKE